MTTCGKFWERGEYQTTLPVSWETCVQVKQQQSEPVMEQPIGSGLRKEYDGAICSHRFFSLYAEHVLRNARPDELQAGIKTGRKNINLRYADDTTLMAESKEELKNTLMRVEEESERASLRLNIKKLRS